MYAFHLLSNQTSKYGHVRHADLFIRYGADINAQNLVGNTPLHVAASHGQVREACTGSVLVNKAFRFGDVI